MASNSDLLKRYMKGMGVREDDPFEPIDVSKLIDETAEALNLTAQVPRKPLDYEEFIKDVVQLTCDAQNLAPRNRNMDSQPFKAWKHELTELLRAIRKLGYSMVPMNVTSRTFWSNASENRASRNNQFETDMADTLMELDVLVKNFNKRGDPLKKEESVVTMPAVATAAPPAAALAVPATFDPGLYADMDKKTLKFLWENLPNGAWKFYGVTMIAALGAGFAVASWDPIHQVLLHWASDFTCLK